ncbi:hypothetical protein KUCAC02_022014, partial [Chaenocephalus aceratus]
GGGTSSDPISSSLKSHISHRPPPLPPLFSCLLLPLYVMLSLPSPPFFLPLPPSLSPCHLPPPPTQQRSSEITPG